MRDLADVPTHGTIRLESVAELLQLMHDFNDSLPMLVGQHPRVGREMKEIPLEGGPIAFRGALGTEHVAMGLVPHRLPSHARTQIPNSFMEFVVAMSAGVRLAFRSPATVIELDVALSGFEFIGMPAAPSAAVFDLVVDGELANACETLVQGTTLLDWSPAMDLVGGPQVTIRFDGLSPTEKEVEVWLPQNKVVGLRALRADAAISPPTAPRLPQWIHYGSSISHCNTAYSPTRVWPAITAKLGSVDLLDLGFAGNCQLDQFVARTIRDHAADFISLKIGINVINGDTLKVRTFAPAVHGFLDTIRDGHPSTPILVVSPIICPVHEDEPGPTVPDQNGRLSGPGRHSKLPPDSRFDTSLTLRNLREILVDIVTGRKRSDPNLHYLDGLELFGPEDVSDLPDQLHPNGDGYMRIGERFAARAFGPGGAFATPTH